MNSEIHEKLTLLKQCIEEEGEILDFDWCGQLLYPYYDHFHDNNPRIRSGSLIAFWGLLIDWHDGSGFPFCASYEKYACHDFERYIDELLKCAPDIRNQYPNLYFVIVELLTELGKQRAFDETFPSIDKQLFQTLREGLLQGDLVRPHDVYTAAYEEAGMAHS